MPTAITHDLCEKIFHKPQSSLPTVPAEFIMRKSANTSRIRPAASDRIKLAINNQIVSSSSGNFLPLEFASEIPTFDQEPQNLSAERPQKTTSIQTVSITP